MEVESTDLVQTIVTQKPAAPTWSFKPVKRRLLPGDPFFEEGDVACCLLLKQILLDEDEEEDIFNTVAEFKCHEPGCKQFFTSVSAYEVHYNSKHRHVCSHCRRFFPSDHLLDVHILEWHDAMFQILAQKQNMYRCLIQSCTERYPTATKRKQHLVKNHKYPPNFRFDKPVKKSKSESKRTSHTADNVSEPMDTGGHKDVNALVETMETVQVTPGSKIYRVPKTISFGRGVARGFERSPRQQGHQKTHQRKRNKQKARDSVSASSSVEKMES